MNTTDFVIVDHIAVGLLVSEGDCRRFCGASQALESLDGLAFADVEEAQAIVSLHLRSLKVSALPDLQLDGNESRAIHRQPCVDPRSATSERLRGTISRSFASHLKDL